ncbi:methyltransferase [Candidatus Woesearchaeota archaeon]|jgi:tRNA (adenine57-N1/adenine58-N1)-methyltransferase catalytic subunit|nr:methyltransferase [Candidatus Woesearchaeota archaeon]
MKVLINSNGKRFLWKSGDLHTEDGIIKESDIKNRSNKIKSNVGKELIKFEGKFQDQLNELRSGPATVNAKDAGTIIAQTGINSKSKIVDAGSGSGFLSAYLSNITNNITTYEKNAKHFKIAKTNLKKIAPKVKIKNRDVFEGIDETNIDLITLDLPDPEKVLTHVENSLNSGAYLVCYLPSITQVQSLIKASEKHNLILEKVLETIEREWTVKDRVCRPNHQMLGHTAFLVFFRKY